MAVTAKRVRKVIIAGEWYTVLTGSFTIEELEFTDDDGNPVHADPLDTRAYRFLTDNRDEYIGPLSAIQLYKLADV